MPTMHTGMVTLMARRTSSYDQSDHAPSGIHSHGYRMVCMVNRMVTFPCTVLCMKTLELMKKVSLSVK